MLHSHLLPGASFPRAPVHPVDRELLPRPKGTSRRSGRIAITPTPRAADVVSRFAFPIPRQLGESAEHGSRCCEGYSRCGIARRGKRPIA